MNIDEIIKKATLSSLKESGLLNEDREQEQELRRQQHAADAMKDFKAPTKKDNENDKTLQDKKSDDADEADDDAGLKPKSPKSEKLPQITVRKVIDKIDDIRAGYSLHTKKGIKDLTLYFNRLSKNEQIALYAFLTGIEQVMDSETEIDGPTADLPAKKPYGIKMKRSKSKVKIPKQKSGKKSKKSDETSPIVVGEAADKSNIKKRLFEINRKNKKRV